MTFGMLKVNAETKFIQFDVLAELIDVAKRRPGMTSFDVTSLCVEAIYESQNAGELTQLLDEFTMNQTINYSNVMTHKSRYINIKVLLSWTDSQFYISNTVYFSLFESNFTFSVS